MIANTRQMALRFYDQLLDAPFRGGMRAALVDATWRRFAPLAKRAGITRIAELTGLDTIGIPVFAAIRPMGRSLSTQQGKGATDAAARVSALMESLETYSAEHLALPVTTASARTLGKRAVDIRKLARPARIDRDRRLRWVEGFDVVAGEPILVPEQAVTLDCTFTRPPLFDISSNGLASGNLIVEAMVHGLAELVERDAEAAWRRAGSDRRIVLDTVTDPICRALIDRITTAGARVFVWDLDSPIAPVVGCAIMEDPREPAWRTLGFYQGFGAHLDPSIAIARAITEAAQTRVTYIAGGRDDFFAFDYARATDPEILIPLWDRLASPCDEPAVVDDLPGAAPTSLGDALAILVDRLRDAGYHQVVAVDLTHPDLGVPVVKMIVPGLATDVELLG
ncbi:MAG TPA: YcaO-like family protein [Kofleriaceae bacterium]|nr:YcaO-like family protein [Kofleriaceae bacterium]